MTDLNTYWLIWMLLAGLLTGSFMNVVICRLPVMIAQETDDNAADYNLLVPRSHCPCCKRTISWYDNIPLLSWLRLKGRCRHCQTEIPWLYPAVEVGCAIGFLAIAGVFPPGQLAAGVALFFWFSMTMSIIDLRTLLLPDKLTLSLLWLGLLFNTFTQFIPVTDAILGAVAGYLSLWCVFWGFKLITGREGLGYGDFKLLAAVGAWCGWQNLPLVLLLASLLGLVYSLAIIVLSRRKRIEQEIAFGPWLALAGWGMFVWQAWLTVN